MWILPKIYSVLVIAMIPLIIASVFTLLYNYISYTALFYIQVFILIIYFIAFSTEFIIDDDKITDHPEEAALVYEYSKELLYLMLAPLVASGIIAQYAFLAEEGPPILPVNEIIAEPSLLFKPPDTPVTIPIITLQIYIGTFFIAFPGIINFFSRYSIEDLEFKLAKA